MLGVNPAARHFAAPAAHDTAPELTLSRRHQKNVSSPCKEKHIQTFEANKQLHSRIDNSTLNIEARFQ
eukprot:Skav215294  [mRNA]  locus=scaffold2522:230205:230408:+ [translate_table: standard]